MMELKLLAGCDTSTKTTTVPHRACYDTRMFLKRQLEVFPGASLLVKRPYSSSGGEGRSLEQCRATEKIVSLGALHLYLRGSRLSPRMKRSFTGLQHRAPEFSRTATMCQCRTVAD